MNLNRSTQATNTAVANFEECTNSESDIEITDHDSDDNNDVESTRDEGSSKVHPQLAKVIRNVVLVSIEGQNQRERLLDICRAADQGEPHIDWISVIFVCMNIYMNKSISV